MMNAKILTAAIAALAFLLLGTIAALAQPRSLYMSDSAAKEHARQMLNELHGGVLIVRLHSNNRKMKELQRLSTAAGTPEKNKKYFADLLDATREETRQESLDMMKAFDGNYNFSRVLFLYDTASLQLKNGVQSGYFLNRELQVDPSLSLGGDKWTMIYFRHETPALFMLLDSQLQPVQRPFPIPRRPLLRPYKQGLFFSDNPEKWALSERGSVLATGFTMFMTYSRKKQFNYFSVMLYHWNNSLVKAGKSWLD